MNFGEIIEQLKKTEDKGFMEIKASRSGWNGKDMFIFLIIPDEIMQEKGFGTKAYRVAYEAKPYIAMKTAQNIIIPWLASQSDILAEDWEIL